MRRVPERVAGIACQPRRHDRPRVLDGREERGLESCSSRIRLERGRAVRVVDVDQHLGSIRIPERRALRCPTDEKTGVESTKFSQVRLAS